MPTSRSTPTFASLHARLAARSGPVLVADGRAWSGAELASLASAWRDALHRAGLRAGDRLVIAIPAGPAFVAALVAALGDGVGVAVARPGEDADALVDEVDARLAIVEDAHAPARLSPASPEPGARSVTARRALGPSTPDVALLLRTSGSTGAPRWIALGEAGVLSVLRSHAHALPGPGDVVASVLPWHHAFGLVLELLAALAGGATLVREPVGGRDPASLASLVRASRATHLSAVPLVIERLAAHDAGALTGLSGGIVGGAPIGAALAGMLRATRLRVGYGLTEASPGVTLGAPGEFEARLLGCACGCEVRMDADDVLAFRGPNAAVGEWRDGALVRHAAGRWVRTGDVVRADGDAYRIVGRASAAFKLANGRWVAAHHVEAALRERCPALREAVLATVDGRGLLLLHEADGALAPEQLRAQVTEVLGPLAALPLELCAVAPDAWPRTAKGEIDRAHVVASLG